MNTPLVTAHWLNEHLNDKDVMVLDASMQQVVGKEPIHYEEFVCIRGTLKFDLETVFFDPESTQLHAMPTIKQFKHAAEKLGISANKHIVIYDNQGIYSSPRAWWMLRSMGVSNVRVLDGGLPEWIANGFETSSRYALAQSTELDIQPNSEMVCDVGHVLSILDSKQHQILDARGQARFLANAPEPRPGVRGGHMPGALNLPFSEVLVGNRMKSPEEMRRLFAEIRLNKEQQVICSCGSGVTACILLLALEIAGFENKMLYDGSWAEWGANPDLPLVAH